MEIRRKALNCIFDDEQKNRLIQKIKNKSKNVNDCWIYEGYIGKSGYVLITFDGCYIKAHRASYIAFKGNIPKELHVCHTCDNRTCVNPDHLWLGTAKNNAEDRDKKGRKASTLGSKNGFNILNEQQVEEIKKMLHQGISQSEIGRKFNVSNKVIWCIAHKKSWSHINVND